MQNRWFLLSIGLFTFLTFSSCSKQKEEAKSSQSDSTSIQTDSATIESNGIIESEGDTISSIISKQKAEFYFTEKDYKRVIPKKVQKYITKNFKSWSYPNAKHWDEFWFKEFASDTSLVNFVQGDFNFDKKTDYAFYLENKKEKKIAYILLHADADTYKTVMFREIAYKGDKPKFNFGLLATYECDSIKCTGTYVTKIAFDKDSTISGYWKDGKYEEVKTKN